MWCDGDMVQLIALDRPPQPDAYGVADSPLGFMLAAWEGDMLVRLHLLPAHTEHRALEFLQDFGFGGKMKADPTRAKNLVSTVLFSNHRWNGIFDAKTKVGFYGTKFQYTIMKKMLSIPNGKTKTYQQLNNAARAVGSVCARNPVPFLVPCHRVTASNGLGNYGFGVPLKRQLLEWEKA